MTYKKTEYSNYKKGQPFRPKGSYGTRSGYLKPTIDLMAPYRHPSQPETEYTKGLRHNLQRSQFRGPSPILLKSYNYATAPQKQVVEKGMTRKEVNELIEESMKETFKKFLETTGERVVPDEVFEVVLDTSAKVAERMEKADRELVDIKNQKPEFLSHLNEVRQEQIKEKMAEADKAQNLEEVQSVMAEVRGINQKYFDQMDMLNDESEAIQKIQTVDMSQVEQRVGGLKAGFDNLIEQNKNLQSEIDAGITTMDALSDRTGILKKQYEDMYYEATTAPASLSSNGLQRRKVDYDSEIGY